MNISENIFVQTNPTINDHKIIKSKFMSTSTKKRHEQYQSAINIFQQQQCKYKYKYDPNQTPLGGHRYFNQIKRRIQGQSECIQTEQSKQNELTKITEIFEKIPQISSIKSRIKTEQCLKSNILNLSNRQRPTKRIIINSSQQIKKQNYNQNKLYVKGENNHFKKLAIIGQLEYKQPLQKKYGEKYFEYTLRNRYKDQKRLDNYLVQVKAQKNEQTAFEKSILKSKKQCLNKLSKVQYLALIGVNKQKKEKKNLLLQKY